MINDALQKLDNYLNGDPDALEYKDLMVIREHIKIKDEALKRLINAASAWAKFPNYAETGAELLDAVVKFEKVQ